MRTIIVEVKPRSGQNKVEKITGQVYKVSVTAAPEKGKANEAVIKLLADYFQVGKSLVTIKSGKTSRQKVVIITG